MDNYAIVADFPDMLVIKDLNNGRTVTNSVKEVLAEVKHLLREGKSLKSLLYFDSYGDLDEIKFDPTTLKFTRFATARHRTKEIIDRIEAL